MLLHINGEERRLDGVTTIASLILKLGLESKKVAIERNLEIVPRSTYAHTDLADGDRIEIVAFIGGG